MPWVLTRGAEHWEGIPPGGATANSPELLMRMALAGAGITIVNDEFALPYVQRGEFVQVLPDWRPPRVSAWAVFPGRRLMPARTRVFLDTLATKFTGTQRQGIEANVRKTKARLRQPPIGSGNRRFARGQKQTGRACTIPTSTRGERSRHRGRSYPSSRQIRHAFPATGARAIPFPRPSTSSRTASLSAASVASKWQGSSDASRISVGISAPGNRNLQFRIHSDSLSESTSD